MNGKRAKEIRAHLTALPLDNMDKWEHTNIKPINQIFWIGGVFQWPLPIYYNSTARRVRSTLRGAYRALKLNVLRAKRDRRRLIAAARSYRAGGSFLSRASQNMNYDRAKEQVHNNWETRV